MFRFDNLWARAMALVALLVVSGPTFPQSPDNGTLHIGIITGYFGRHPALQRYSLDVVSAAADSEAPKASIVVVPFEMAPGEPIEATKETILSSVPGAPMPASKGGHDNEAAAHHLARLADRWLLITNSPSVANAGRLRGGRLPIGAWQRSIRSRGSNLELTVIGSETMSAQAEEWMRRFEVASLPNSPATIANPKPSMGRSNAGAPRPWWYDALLAIPSVLTLAVFLRFARNLKESRSGKGEGTVGNPEAHPSQPLDKESSADEINRIVSELDGVLNRIGGDLSEETAKLRQTMAEMRRDTVRFDETALGFAGLLHRMRVDDQNDLAVKENCSYLLARLKRYFERAGLDIVAPEPGDEFQEDLHDIVGTVPADAKHPHMTIVAVEELGVRRGQEIRQAAKVVVATETQS